jgi:hypothetical protein
MRNGLVKLIDAETEKLKLWETLKGKPMIVMDNSSLVLARAGRHMGYRVSNKKLVNKN